MATIGQGLSSRGRALVFGCASLLLAACTPGIDPGDTKVIGPEGGRYDSSIPAGGDFNDECELTVEAGALNSPATFGGKAYLNPADMARDTAPPFPFLQDALKPGCYYEPLAPPLHAGRHVQLSWLWPTPHARADSDRLAAEGRDNLSFIWIMYRADPFGEWRPESIAYDAFAEQSSSVGTVMRGRSPFDMLLQPKVRRLGYSVIATGLYFSPNLPETLTLDEGAPVPYALGLAGTLTAFGAPPIRLSYLDFRNYELSTPYVPLSPESALTGFIPFQDAWRSRSEVTITLRAEYLGSLQVDTGVPGPSYFLSRSMQVTFVASPPRIDTQPADAAVDEGRTATVTVAAGGSRPLTYQWQRNGIDIVGATAVSYTTPATTLADDGAMFTVVASNARGITPSAAARLTVTPGPAMPAIARGPMPLTVTAGAPARFDVVATGAPPLSYQWLRNGHAVVGATDSSYELPATTLGDDGALFAVRVSNAVNPAGVVSTAALPTVTRPDATVRGVIDVVSLTPVEALGGPDSGAGGLKQAVSQDGRYVAFVSSAALTGGGCGVFLRDMAMRSTRLITVRPDGSPGSGPAGSHCLNASVAMTPDARHVAFTSDFTNLVDRALGTSLQQRVYVRDTCIGAAACVPRTTLVSVDDADVPLNGGGTGPSISDDGRYIAFEGQAPQVVTPTAAAVVHDRDADGNGVYDERPAVPVPASPTFRTFAVSRKNDGTLFNAGWTPMISGNGRHVVFVGSQTPAGDCSAPSQIQSICVYVYDRDADNNGIFDQTTLPGGVRTINVSVNNGGHIAQGGNVLSPGISADGRMVSFRSDATNLGGMASLMPLYVLDRDVTASGSFDTPGNMRLELASLDALGAEVQTTDYRWPRGASRHGRFVLIEGRGSWAGPPDPLAPSGSQHLYLRDTCLGSAASVPCVPSTVRLSLRRNGELPEPASFTSFGALSGDGRRVVFTQTGGALVDLNADGLREEHTSIEVYYAATGTGEP